MCVNGMLNDSCGLPKELMSTGNKKPPKTLIICGEQFALAFQRNFTRKNTLSVTINLWLITLTSSLHQLVQILSQKSNH